MDKRSCWKASRWIAVELNGPLAVYDVGWWYLASNGVDWWMASMVGWRRMASNGQEGADVEVLLVSMVVATSGVEWWLVTVDTRGY